MCLGTFLKNPQKVNKLQALILNACPTGARAAVTTIIIADLVLDRSGYAAQKHQERTQSYQPLVLI